MKTKSLLLLTAIAKEPGMTIAHYSKITNTTYSHTLKLIRQMSDNGLLVSDKQMNQHCITLSQKGKGLVGPANLILGITAAKQ